MGSGFEGYVASAKTTEGLELAKALQNTGERGMRIANVITDQKKDKAVEKIYSKVKNKNISDEQKVEYIEKIISKLEKVEEKTKSEKVKELILYFVEKFEEKIEVIEQKDDIESIFNILEE